MSKKIFATSSDIVEIAEKKFQETGLASVGVRLNVMSTTKANSVVEVRQIGATEKFKTKSELGINMIIYEDAFDRLSDKMKEDLIEGALSKVSYDSEKDRLTVDNSQYGELLRMRIKHDDYLDTIETSLMTIEDIAEEEKERKREEKEAKKNKKNMQA